MADVKHNPKSTDRPAYADFDAPAKFAAIESIIAKRLVQHPKAICSYSGGSDSDIMIDLIERTRKLFGLPPVKYVFFNTGLELQATKDHVKATTEKYDVEIETVRPKIGIVQAARTYGIPFKSKIFSSYLSMWQQKNIPLSIVDEFNQAVDKSAKFKELTERYPKSVTVLTFLLNSDRDGKPLPHFTQGTIGSAKYLSDYIRQTPIDFKISAKCCDYCKKQVAHEVQSGFDMTITGEREAEGGVRSMTYFNKTEQNTSCFATTSDGRYKLRPLYYVSDKDKAWYKEHYGIRYSDAYEVYGLTRTGCCGCPISCKAVEDLEKIRPYEPNVVKAAWNIFGKSYEYRQKYNAYKEERKAADRADK